MRRGGGRRSQTDPRAAARPGAVDPADRFAGTLFAFLFASAMGSTPFSPVQRHRQAAARPQRQAALRLDLGIIGNAHPEALRKDRRHRIASVRPNCSPGQTRGPLAKGM